MRAQNTSPIALHEVVIGCLDGVPQHTTVQTLHEPKGEREEKLIPKPPIVKSFQIRAEVLVEKEST